LKIHLFLLDGLSFSLKDFYAQIEEVEWGAGIGNRGVQC
jgi:hypothetical protein